MVVVIDCRLSYGTRKAFSIFRLNRVVLKIVRSLPAWPKPDILGVRRTRFKCAMSGLARGAFGRSRLSEQVPRAISGRVRRRDYSSLVVTFLSFRSRG